MLPPVILIAAPVPEPSPVPATAPPTASPSTAKNEQPIPPQLKAMLDAAIASGNENDITIISKYASNAAPEAAKTIKASVDGWRKAREAKRVETIVEAGPLDLWKGSVQLGGYATTGNTNDLGVSAAVKLSRETLRWKHTVNVAVDYKQSSGVISREHYLASYEPNYKFSERGYIYGTGSYESDRFLGYYDRYATSVGAGYGVVRASNVKLDLEVGPAYRRTSFTDETEENSFAARGSMDFNLKLNRAISITQAASAYLQRINSTVSSTTAINAKLFGPLSAKLSYAVQYESTPPEGRVNTDTSSTASIVYSF
ncbi:DUF481 domain-containing protein [Sphingomonas sp. GC_Shp_3]|uniref:DUF481 domain-containing protein n=1 Tax=Sphingomonas sp. GC_Shp_3 TaxID=2937383 RepID=UPI00226A0D1A|nr:DUF481 domain-containing protein [Sphingomonas sp. GC_Shp_3]